MSELNTKIDDMELNADQKEKFKKMFGVENLDPTSMDVCIRLPSMPDQDKKIIMAANKDKFVWMSQEKKKCLIGGVKWEDITDLSYAIDCEDDEYKKNNESGLRLRTKEGGYTANFSHDILFPIFCMFLKFVRDAFDALPPKEEKDATSEE